MKAKIRFSAMCIFIGIFIGAALTFTFSCSEIKPVNNDIFRQKIKMPADSVAAEQKKEINNKQ